MNVHIVRIADCGTYTRTNRWVGKAKPTKKYLTGTDSKGRAVKKRIYRCECEFKARNRATVIVRLDNDHNCGRTDEFMPLQDFVRHYMEG